MIVISQSLTLAPTGDTRPNAPLIGWRNIVTASGISADTADPDYPASNLANPSTAARWQATDTSLQYLTFTVGGDEPVDYVGIARHNLSSGITVSIDVEYPDDPDTWVEIVEEFIPADNAPILARFEPDIYSRIRIKLQPTSTIPRVAVVYIGKLLILQRNIYVGHTPITFGRSARITNAMAESGDYLGRIVLTESLATSVELQNLTPMWYRQHLDPFIAAAKTTPFFWAWRPTSYPHEIGYSWIKDVAQPSNQRPNGMMQISIQMGGVAI